MKLCMLVYCYTMCECECSVFCKKTVNCNIMIVEQVIHLLLK